MHVFFTVLWQIAASAIALVLWIIFIIVMIKMIQRLGGFRKSLQVIAAVLCQLAKWLAELIALEEAHERASSGKKEESSSSTEEDDWNMVIAIFRLAKATTSIAFATITAINLLLWIPWIVLKLVILLLLILGTVAATVDAAGFEIAGSRYLKTTYIIMTAVNFTKILFSFILWIRFWWTWSFGIIKVPVLHGLVGFWWGLPGHLLLIVLVVLTTLYVLLVLDLLDLK